MVDSDRIKSRLLGEFNVRNILAALCTGLVIGLPMAGIKKGLERIEGVPGRFEQINEGQDFCVIIDYAFEPQAVIKLYKTIELFSHNQIIHVLGSAGGGRDIARRPKLGIIAGGKADYVIVTNEDPYDDDPEIIIDQVALGAEKAGKVLNKDLFKIIDRRAAIKKALFVAQTGDIVLVTGKGSEQAICVNQGKKIPWDDRAITRGLIREIMDNKKEKK